MSHFPYFEALKGMMDKTFSGEDVEEKVPKAVIDSTLVQAAITFSSHPSTIIAKKKGVVKEKKPG